MQLTRDDAAHNPIDQQRHQNAWNGKLHIGKTHDDRFVTPAEITCGEAQ